jgi:SAM-dependent methyltransferase
MIYDQFVDAYYKRLGRYENFPAYVAKYNNKKWEWENKDFPRVIALYRIKSKKALVFNGKDDPEWEYLPHKDIHDYHYVKDTGENDIHKWNGDHWDFDFAMTNQTLEHVYDPLLCLQNIHRHLAPNGWFYANVPVFNLPHETPLHHYTGFTPVGLGSLVTSAGFVIQELGFWGNYEYFSKILEKKSWIDYTEMSSPLLNQPEYAVITWVLAQKKEL